ncbi:hypothetical protein HDU96_000440 [Phlyctochytrium bullatum]|nr:hypothetical protein HDU96_000440 [Phlyctochytrium bullatum]
MTPRSRAPASAPSPPPTDMGIKHTLQINPSVLTSYLSHTNALLPTHDLDDRLETQAAVVASLGWDLEQDPSPETRAAHATATAALADLRAAAAARANTARALARLLDAVFASDPTDRRAAAALADLRSRRTRTLARLADTDRALVRIETARADVASVSTSLARAAAALDAAWAAKNAPPGWRRGGRRSAEIPTPKSPRQSWFRTATGGRVAPEGEAYEAAEREAREAAGMAAEVVARATGVVGKVSGVCGKDVPAFIPPALAPPPSPSTSPSSPLTPHLTHLASHLTALSTHLALLAARLPARQTVLRTRLAGLAARAEVEREMRVGRRVELFEKAVGRFVGEDGVRDLPGETRAGGGVEGRGRRRAAVVVGLVVKEGDGEAWEEDRGVAETSGEAAGTYASHSGSEEEEGGRRVEEEEEEEEEERLVGGRRRGGMAETWVGREPVVA